MQCEKWTYAVYSDIKKKQIWWKYTKSTSNDRTNIPNEHSSSTWNISKYSHMVQHKLEMLKLV